MLFKDGETNLKLRTALPTTDEKFEDEISISHQKGVVNCELPNRYHYNFLSFEIAHLKKESLNFILWGLGIRKICMPRHLFGIHLKNKFYPTCLDL